MFRRRRPQREIPFSFDSFLDVVANVVGIIIRLILVAWIGARTYKAVVPLPPLPPPPAALAEPEPLPDPTDPRLDEIARRREELARQRRESLGKNQHQCARIEDESGRLRREIAEVVGRREELRRRQEEIKGESGDRAATAKTLLLSLEELQKRSSKLLEELKKANEPVKASKELRYRTPVSVVVQTEEVMFECRRGRVTLLDTAALLAQIQRGVRGKAEPLRDRWSVSDVTAPVGAFRLRYVVERERTALDGPGTGAPIGGVFRYGLSGWEAEAVQEVRGEPGEMALLADSEFRKVVDALDAQQTVVTFWVYPDSFALYRKLRDFLHERDVVVAGRPLPEGVPIASSRHGTASRGQ